MIATIAPANRHVPDPPPACRCGPVRPAAACSAAYAQNCGSTLTATLHADLPCTSGWVALSSGAGDITIHLNGHTISGSTALQGIHVDGVTFTDLGVPMIVKESAASTLTNGDFSGRAGGRFATQRLPAAGGRPDLGGHAFSTTAWTDSIPAWMCAASGFPATR